MDKLIFFLSVCMILIASIIILTSIEMSGLQSVVVKDNLNAITMFLSCAAGILVGVVMYLCYRRSQNNVTLNHQNRVVINPTNPTQL